MAEEVKEGDTTVRVAVRVRPISQKEINEGGQGIDCVEVLPDGCSLNLHVEGQGPHTFAFDHVFGSNSTQPEVFEKLGMPLLDKSFEGYNATVFAYGQTGSGKTHTMMSDRKSDDRGLIPRISENLFERINKLTSDSRKFLIQCSFLEIYNEIVYDLLVPRGKLMPKTGLEIREQKGMGVYVKDLQEIVVDSSEKLQKLIDQGFEHRATASTNMNATSSRSHCLFIVRMHQKDDVNPANNNFSKINLVDLAGSERASKTGAQGDTLKEGANINKSLSSLGNVINALSKMAAGGGKKVFIPYRDSKLTRVLQESLGGNALTTMMAACSPSRTNCDETLSTLNYAKRAKTIKVNASKNEEAEQLAKLEAEVDALRAKLLEQASGVADTSKYEKQIEEMERFMKQTWEDKEQATVQHEEERKLLELEAQKAQGKVVEERLRRLKLLEEKGDLELSIQDLRSHHAEPSLMAYTANWPDQVKRLTSLEQRIAAQCRAVALCKEAVLADIQAWAEHRKENDENGGATRILLTQADRKSARMLKEIEVLDKMERELENSLGCLQPDVRRTMCIVEAFVQEEKKATEEEKAAEKKEKGGEEEKGAKKGEEKGMDEFCGILSMVSRQLDSKRAKAWKHVAKEHKQLGHFGDGLKGMLQSCKALSIDTSALARELELELEAGGTSGAGTMGAEAAASLARPLGLADGTLPDGALTASSNQEAAADCRLMGGPETGAFGGWCPAKDAGDEYLQVDLGAPTWVCGIGVQGRQPAAGLWEQTRPLVAKVIEPDPLPPKRIFQRPPVRLIHDVVVAAHTRHKAFDPAGGDAFQAAALDYRQLQKFDRQAKVDFFEQVVGKTNAALRAMGVPEDEVPDLAITPDDILRGKNTAESNRLLQLVGYLAMLKKAGASAGGLLACGDQWMTQYRLYWSADGQSWESSMAGAEPVVLRASADAGQISFSSLGYGRPQVPVRFLRLYPAEWVRHPGFRVEVFGWAEGEQAAIGAELTDRGSRLDIFQAKATCIKDAMAKATAIALEEEIQKKKAMEEEKSQARDEKTQGQQQLQDALKQIEELSKANTFLEERSAENEQKLIDADTEKLKLEVDRDRAEALAKELEEKHTSSKANVGEEKAKVHELEARVEEAKATNEDLTMQIGVLTEERDCARAKEEELYDTLCAREEELMNTNDGYVYLTEHLHEVREELEEKVDQRDRVIETLNERNGELQSEGITLRQQIGELKRSLQEKEKAVQRAAQGLPISFTASPASTTTKTPESESPDKKKKKKEAGGVQGDSEYEEDFDDE